MERVVREHCISSQSRVLSLECHGNIPVASGSKQNGMQCESRFVPLGMQKADAGTRSRRTPKQTLERDAFYSLVEYMKTRDPEAATAG